MLNILYMCSFLSEFYLILIFLFLFTLKFSGNFTVCVPILYVPSLYSLRWFPIDALSQLMIFKALAK